MIHDHLARAPIAHDKLDPQVAPALSDIIMKLLEKEPDRRYQCAEGLERDLVILRERLANDDREPFPLCESDFPLRLSAPRIPVWRTVQLEFLLKTFEKTAALGASAVFISGEPGVGKTALVNEMRPGIKGLSGWQLWHPYLLEDQEVRSGTSVGIALYPGDADNAENLLKCADLALYEAKNRGRFNYQFYRQEMSAAAQESQRIERELRRALHEDELRMHYQPQFDLKSGRITGIEALIRWQPPEKRLLVAAEFIQDAEYANLMLPIGEWAICTACKQHHEWVRAGLDVPITLNVSSKQLRQGAAHSLDATF